MPEEAAKPAKAPGPLDMRNIVFLISTALAAFGGIQVGSPSQEPIMAELKVITGELKDIKAEISANKERIIILEQRVKHLEEK